jgi:uncharacterized surface protein with fasciclin (FAS1) repeats
MKQSAIIGIVVVALLAIGGVALMTMSGDSDESTDVANSNTSPTSDYMDDTMEKEMMEEEEMEMDEEMEEPTDTIADLAVATDSLSTLVAALDAAELVEVFADEDAEFTVFAPTNEAFADIQSSVDELLLPENQADLQNVLQYHVVEGAVYASDLEDGMTVTMLNGDTATVTIDDDGTVMVGDATVASADIEASNGVVHVIDTVLLP